MERRSEWQRPWRGSKPVSSDMLEWDPSKGNLFEFVLQKVQEARAAHPEYVPVYDRDKVKSPGKEL